MALTATKCMKIETAGLVIGWSYFVAFLLGFLAILVASVIGMKIYIAGGDGVLQALLIFFVMIVSLTVVGIFAFITQNFIKGVENRNIPKVRHFKFLIWFLLFLSFISLIIALIGATKTFDYQKSFDKPSTPPLGLEYVVLAIALFFFHFTILIIVDIIHKKFNHYEIREQIYKENLNLTVVSSYQPRKIQMKVPEIELPPPPSKF
ncbi:hypothetical protein PVAND_005748 [Polypedilum vanderplanki]|uniref:Uncharacterized protein n=1 Tax=Polypedilum vanderplanki TaxID=319348 RepID=A0A9J6C1I7_POLVA|nr:hypothetical protein PVAND_005748 [Polypedilum vanderplanki]